LYGSTSRETVTSVGALDPAAIEAAASGSAMPVVSAYTADLLAAVAPRSADVRLIPPGIALPDAAASIAAGSSAPTLVTVSRLVDPYKGHDVLLAALPAVRARIPDVRWVVIGDGPLRPALEEQARAAGLAEAVSFLGSVPDSERDGWLARADVFAMPSRLPGGRLAGEGFGISYMEAAARGTPALAGNVGGAVDSVVDGVTGLLVDPADTAAVTDALVRLLSDRELARRLGAAAEARAQEFAWPVIGARVEALLLELAARSPG